MSPMARRCVSSTKRATSSERNRGEVTPVDEVYGARWRVAVVNKDFRRQKCGCRTTRGPACDIERDNGVVEQGSVSRKIESYFHHIPSSSHPITALLKAPKILISAHTNSRLSNGSEEALRLPGLFVSMPGGCGPRRSDPPASHENSNDNE